MAQNVVRYTVGGPMKASETLNDLDVLAGHRARIKIYITQSTFVYHRSINFGKSRRSHFIYSHGFRGEGLKSLRLPYLLRVT